MAVHHRDSDGVDKEGWIRTNLNFCKDLPSPDAGEWTTDDCEWDSNKILLPIQKGVVEKVRKESVRGRSFWVYRTNPDAWAYIQEKLGERENVMPCGHSGFRNLNGESFTCGYVDCEARHSRAEVEEAISDE